MPTPRTSASRDSDAYALAAFSLGFQGWNRHFQMHSQLESHPIYDAPSRRACCAQIGTEMGPRGAICGWVFPFFLSNSLPLSGLIASPQEDNKGADLSATSANPQFLRLIAT